ncbi:trypco2 family protein [Dendronalium sp. ChiSLP03b]|uniref:trypco2 family protein n=1 Tax=Dendronalium sp. ChiSLP03b TaxID=3075381 RepID=UPI003919FBCC
MSEENSIGLAELIEQIKQELLSTEAEGEKPIPLFSVDQVNLELQVTARKEGKAGIKVYVVELGSGGSRDDVQKVTVTLTPLLSKEERITLYKTRYPQKWKLLEETSIEGLMKGSNNQPLGDLLG